MAVEKETMKPVYIKGLRGEIVRLDSIDRFWKELDEKTDKWSVLADSRTGSTRIFEGSETEVNAFVESLDDVFLPYDLTNEKHRNFLKVNKKPQKEGQASRPPLKARVVH